MKEVNALSSYHSSFTYLKQNSANDKHLIIATFTPDNGEVDTFLSMTASTDDYYNGTKRFDYGARYDSVATINITLIKPDNSDFSVAENRDVLKWLTGARTNSWLDFYEGDEVKYSFFGRVTDVKQQKLDARVFGIIITFTSVNPWAYSAIQEITYDLVNDGFGIDENGVIYQNETMPYFGIDDKGVLYIDNGTPDVFDITDYGVIYKVQGNMVQIDNKTDDLYTYINLDIEYVNKQNSDTLSSLTVKNLELDEESSVVGISGGEVITFNSGQFISSNIPGKIFGDNFNFVWPRLQPGINKIAVNGAGEGIITFKYRYPIKIGDCAVDIENILNNPQCCDYINGEDDDDVQKITYISLLAENWAGTESPYSQVVTVNGVTERSRVDLQPTTAQIIELQKEDASLVTENNAGTVTVYAIGNKPSADHTIQTSIVEVKYL